jgi:hypothetical protein
MIPLSFPSFSEFLNVVPLLQTCSTYMFVYDHARFCVYIYLLDLTSTYERKHAAFIFLNLTFQRQYCKTGSECVCGYLWRVNERDLGEGTWLMDFIYKIEQ